MFTKSRHPLCRLGSRSLGFTSSIHHRMEFSITQRSQNGLLQPMHISTSEFLQLPEEDRQLLSINRESLRPKTARNPKQMRHVFQGTKGVSVVWDDGHESHFHYIWLRDSCDCPGCRHPSSQERLVDTSKIPLNIAAQKAAIDEHGNLVVEWDQSSQRGHKSIFSAAWLREHCYSKNRLQGQPNAQDKKNLPALWDASISESLPEISYKEIIREDAGLKKWLDLLETYGFALVRNVPSIPGQSVLLANRIAYPRQTFWGTSYDVKAEPNPANLSLTGLELKCHTDFSWSESPPKYQFLHCLKVDSNIQGGESILVDGFKVSEVMRQQDPCAWRLLTKVKLPYYFKGENAFYHHSGPVFQLNENEELIGVRYNQANRGPLNVQEDNVEATYDALHKFAALLSDKSLALRFHLRPGDMVSFNNRRLLHGRGSFSENVERHLEGCYLDGEEFMSRMAVLTRRLAQNSQEGKERRDSTGAVTNGRPEFAFPSAPSPLNHKKAASGFSPTFHTSPRMQQRQQQRQQHATHQTTRKMSTWRQDKDVSAEVAAVYGAQKEVAFVHMKDGTKEDYEFMGLVYDLDMQKNMVNRVLNMMEPLKDVKNGAKIDLYEHSLQAATRALKGGADEETVVCALLHDVGELLCPQNHGEIPAGILKPFISPENYWVLANHEVFQGYYYFHFLGGNKHTRDVYKHHPCYERATDFCEKYDQSSFDPGYKSLPLDDFLPMVHRVFAKKAYFWDPENPKTGCVTGKK